MSQGEEGTTEKKEHGMGGLEGQIETYELSFESCTFEQRLKTFP